MPATYGATVAELEAGKPPYKVVVPKKLPLGKKVSGTKKPGLFRVYVPTNQGGELLIKTSAGTIAALNAPDGNPAKDAAGQAVAVGGNEVKFETPQGVAGWYGIVVDGATSYQLESAFTIRGHAKDRDGSMLVPWHFYYFPFTKVAEWADHPSKKYDGKFPGSGAFDWEKTNYWKSELDSNFQRGPGGDGHGIDEAACQAYNARCGTNYSVKNCGWWGHCDAAATASAIFHKPSGGAGFSAFDVQWMVTELAMRHYDIRCEFHLGGESPATRKHPSNKETCSPEGGQHVDKDVGRFHHMLVKLQKNLAQPILMDFRALQEWGGAEDVWNQLVYKFESKVVQADDDVPGGDETEAARKVKVETKLTANADNEDLARQGSDPESDQKGWIRECVYVIHYDANGNVNQTHPGNNWIETKWGSKPGYPPRYFFSIKGLNFGAQFGGNPKVKWENVRTLVQMRPLFAGG